VHNKILIFDLAQDPVAPTAASGENDRQDDNDPEEPGPMAGLDWGERREEIGFQLAAQAIEPRHKVNECGQ
jgi:hypothetical protein